MNPKTVNKILKRKHNDFMNHIKDEDIKKIFNEKSIVSGGSIVSMLLNEKVNDYDYYLTDKESCQKVAEYFVGQYKQAHPEGAGMTPNTNKKITPPVMDDEGRIRIVIKSVGIAGEEINESPYQDFESRPMEDGEEYVEGITGPLHQAVSKADDIPASELEKGKEPYRVIFMTSNAITLSNGIQIIIRFYGTPEEIHKNYDFIHCTNFWEAKEYKLHLNQPALESILSKTLYYSGSIYPLCSVIRTRKFIKKGWHINAGQYLKMCFQISELDLKNIDVLDDQLMGVDNAYFFQVIEYLKKRMEEDKEFKIELPYLISIIDKIF